MMGGLPGQRRVARVGAATCRSGIACASCATCAASTVTSGTLTPTLGWMILACGAFFT